MYNCEKEFNKFYQEKVVLSALEQNELREKHKLNVKRLKDGFLKYNKENVKNYKIAEERIQGSMAMHTITQNDENDYDIDIGIVFGKDDLDSLGPLATRNLVANVLKEKTKQFAELPEVKTSCVRLKYNSLGYHMDFAIFQRYKESQWNNDYTYEHAGAEWSIRHVKGIEEWFSEQIKYLGDDLRKVVRLSKMFCKSRESWKEMPSGLLQTVLCNEKFKKEYSRLDEKFYYTMQEIVVRLNNRLNVSAPVDNRRPLVTRNIDYKRMSNWKNHLESNLKKLDIIFDENCKRDDALKAWSHFFNHSYWEEMSEVTQKRINEQSQEFSNTEQFIEELYPIHEQYTVTIDCKVSGNGFSPMPIEKFLNIFPHKLKKFIPFNFSIICSLSETDCDSYDKILWKVRNNGLEAERRDCIRGQIIDKRGTSIKETSNFRGLHYIECYLIKNDICVGIGHVDIPIGED